jgi:hypothetical protein
VRRLLSSYDLVDVEPNDPETQRLLVTYGRSA